MAETQRPSSTQRPSGTLRPPGTNAKKGGTLRPDSDIKPFEDAPEVIDDAPKTGTARPNLTQRKQTARPQTKAADVKVLKRGAQPTAIHEFTLGNVTYTVEGLISSSTGEAEIYKLSKGGKTYALKLYYSGYSPDPEVMEILRKSSGTGFLADLIDCGSWMSPQGELREYELQPFYTGGELTPGMMAGNPDRLKTTAAGMIMALKVAHDHNILHKDIKPGNFFYRDESHTQLILADFGIASAFKRDKQGRMVPLKAYAQWRTKIYAAPEIYTAIDGEIEYPDEKSDYYSLGMSLLTLWIGEKAFEGIDERAMIRLKRGESGTLPYPDDMPQQMLHLIRGLTVPNPEKRWGFAEFERWARGENVPVEDNLRPTAGGLNILYNGSKNQVATSKEELAALMLEDTKLAEQYLYSGKVSKWFADAGYPEWQTQLDEVVNKLYPKSRYSGVMAACYMLDPALPFMGIDGKPLETQESIAIEMWNNQKRYREMLAHEDAPLYIFLEASGIKAREMFLPMFKRQPWTAIWRMIFSLYPRAPFPFYDTAAKSVKPVYDIAGLIEAFEHSDKTAYDNYAMSANCEIYTPFLLYDECFITWLAAQDPALAGKIKSIVPSKAWQRPGFYFYIFYMLAPERNYDYVADQEHNFTVAQLAETFNQQYLDACVLGKSSSKGFYDLDMRDGKENRLSYYLRSKGMYKDKFDYLEYCFELDSDDNRRKAGPYDLDIAYFKAFKALAGSAFYYFPESGITVSDLDALDQVPEDEQVDQLRDGKLAAWLAVQYQEDPFADLSEDYAYETLLAEYTVALAEIDPDIEELERFNIACDEVEDRGKEIRRKIRSIRILRGVWAALVFVPLLLVSAAYVWWGVIPTAEPTSWKWLWIPVLMFAIPLRFVQSLPGMDDRFTSMFGEKLGLALTCHRWITAIIIAAVPFCLLVALEHWGGDYGRWFMPVICLAVAGVQYYRTLWKNKFSPDLYDNEIHPDEEATVIEPLFYAWKDKGTDKEFESSLADDQEFYSDALSAIRRQTVRKTVSGVVWAGLLVFLWLAASPVGRPLLYNSFPDMEMQDGVKPLSGNMATTTYQVVNVNNALNVRVSPSAQSQAIGQLPKDATMEVIEIKDGFAKIKYNGGEGYVNAAYIKKAEKTE